MYRFYSNLVQSLITQQPKYGMAQVQDQGVNVLGNSEVTMGK